MKCRRSAALVATMAAMLIGVTSTAIAEDDRTRVSSEVTLDAGPAQMPAGFEAMSPVRVLDTRNGTGGFAGLVGPAQTITIDLSPWVPFTATAVALNVTGTGPTINTFVTVYPTGFSRPPTSNLNLVAGQTRANAVTVAIPTDGRLSLFNNAGHTHLVADLAGFYDPESPYGYTPRSPIRALDTRNGSGALGPGAARTLDLSNLVPTTASAVTFNLTAVGATANTFITAWPGGVSRPLASNLNLGPNQTVPNQVTVAIGPNRRVNLYNNVGTTHLIVDVAGFYALGQGSAFHALTPDRIYDSRPDQGLTPDMFLVLEFDGELPSTATAVTFNLTGTNPTAAMYLTSWPGQFPEPNASNLNLVPGQTAANQATVALSDDLEVWTLNSAGYVDLIVDLAGYFDDSMATGGS
jgi:hypothetical protein